jgi:signal peptidase I
MKKTGHHIKKKISENIKAITYAVIAALIIRTFMYEPFRIPSSSMVPSMLVGDYLFVSKYSYGYSDTGSFFRLPILKDASRIIAQSTPKRGEIAVFKLPSNPKINYIKRVIGEPGDTVQIRNEVIYINGIAVDKTEDGSFSNEDGALFRKYIETTFSGKSYNVIEEIANDEHDNTEEFQVPQGHYFVMGDNRDHSADSRTSQIEYPFVPLENFVGRAEMIFFSMDYNKDNWSSNKPLGIRFNRMFNLINKSL